MSKPSPKEADIEFAGMGAWISDTPNIPHNAGNMIIGLASLESFLRPARLQLKDTDYRSKESDMSSLELFVISRSDRPVSEKIYHDSHARSL